MLGFAHVGVLPTDRRRAGRRVAPGVLPVSKEIVDLAVFRTSKLIQNDSLLESAPCGTYRARTRAYGQRACMLGFAHVGVLPTDRRRAGRRPAPGVLGAPKDRCSVTRKNDSCLNQCGRTGQRRARTRDERSCSYKTTPCSNRRRAGRTARGRARTRNERSRSGFAHVGVLPRDRRRAGRRVAPGVLPVSKEIVVPWLEARAKRDRCLNQCGRTGRGRARMRDERACSASPTWACCRRIEDERGDE
jgi:hypothetical protein